MAQAITHLSQQPPAPGKMTFEEFLEWCDEDTNAEWVDGEVAWMSPVTVESQDVGKFLLLLISLYVEHHQSGRVFYERFLMRLRKRPSGREPDILFVANDNLHRLKRTYLDGPADLAVEVVAEESQIRDRQHKFQEYEQAGVREYWIIDPEARSAEFYQLDSGGRYKLTAPDSAGIYHSAVLIGLWVKVDWLWQNPRPSTLSILREWNII